MNDQYEIYKIIGKNIRQKRRVLDLTQEEFAEAVDISESLIGKIEASNVDYGISIDMLLLLARKMNCDIREFFDGADIFVDKTKKTNCIENIDKYRKPKVKKKS